MAKPFAFTNIIAGSAAVTNAASGGQLPDIYFNTVVISSPSVNTKNIFIGPADSALVSGGFMLAPGEAISLDIDNLDRLYAGTNAAGQIIRYIGLR